MVINILKFLIISTDDFNLIVTSLGLNLSTSSDMYLITYLFTNLFAFLVIYAFIKIVMLAYNTFLSRKFRKW